MPNWSYCDLLIKGDEKIVDRFKKFAKGDRQGKGKIQVLDENKFIPYPKKFMELDKVAKMWGDDEERITKKGTPQEKIVWELDKGECPDDGFNQGGYEWCSANWGTKWGICCPSITSQGEGEIQYHFECAWQPCFPVIKEMSKEFPKLKFELIFNREGEDEERDIEVHFEGGRQWED